MYNDNFLYVIILIAVLLAALGLNAFLDFRNDLNRKRRERLNWLSQQSSHTLNALAILKQSGCRADIIEKLDQHAMSLIEEMIALSPKLNMGVPDPNEAASAVTPQQLTSDRAIKRAQIYIKFAEKLMIELAHGGRITMQLAQTYKQELYWLSVTVVADGHINQAKTLESAGAALPALSHLKHAKAVLVRAMVSADLKQSRLQSLQGDINRLDLIAQAQKPNPTRAF